jgi:hypothetical protein
MQRSRLAATVLALVLVGATAACGGSSKSSSAPPETTTQAKATTTRAAETTTSAAATSSGGSFTDAKNCTQLASLAAKVQQSVTPTGNGSVDLSREADAMNALADAAPGAIKGDFRTFAAVFASFAKAYADSGLKAGTAPTPAQVAKLTAASKKFSSPKVQAAIQHLEAWSRTHCAGFTSTTP